MTGQLDGNNRENRAGGSDFVSVVEVIDVGSVEVDRSLHETQAEETRVEIDIALAGRLPGS